MTDTATAQPAAPSTDRTAEARAFFKDSPAPTSARDLSTYETPQSDVPHEPIAGVTTQADDTPLSRPTLPNRFGDALTAGDVDRFAKIAEAAGMPTAYAQRALDFFASRIQSSAVNPTRPEDAVRVLKSDWGATFDAKLRAAHHAMDVLGLREAVKRAGLTNDVPLVRYLAELGAHFAARPAQVAKTREARAELRGDAQREYDRLMKDPTSPYWSKRDPVAHKAAVAEIARLSAVLYGTAPANPDTDAAPRTAADHGEAIAGQALKARAVIDSWLANPKHPLNVRHDPRHKEAVEHFQKLNAIVARAQGEPHAAAIIRQEQRRDRASRRGTGRATRGRTR